MTTNNMNTPHNDRVKNNVLDKIRSGEVKMHSKYIYFFKVSVIIALAVFVTFISSALISFIMFSVIVSGRLILLGFGFRGLVTFIITFPWLLLLIDLGLVVMLERLIKHFKFGYRTPLVYSIGAIVAANIIIGIVIYESPLHHTIARNARVHHIPVIGDTYRHVRLPPREFGVFRGVVTSMGTSSFVVQSINVDADSDADNQNGASTTSIRTVFVHPDIPFQNIIMKGDYVFVAGDIRGDDIFAFGLQKLSTTTDYTDDDVK
jgi:hypothetical protein